MAIKNIFIFQIRRVGDFFQSFPLINNLYLLSKNSNVKIDILIDGSLAGLREFLTDDVNLLTYNKIIKNNAIEKEWRPLDFIKLVSSSEIFIDGFLQKYSLAINLNYDYGTSYLMHFFKSSKKKGFIADKKAKKLSGTISCRGAANYFYNSIKYRGLNKINIVDIFSLIGTDYPAVLQKKYKFLKIKRNERNKNSGKIRICISTGASSEKRRWPASSYAKLIELINLSFDCEITLVGTKADSLAAREIKSLLKFDIIDITGKTAISELVYFMKDFDLIISSDTGTLHIAQILGVDSISIFTGNANFYETGPHIKKSAVIYSKAGCYPCLEHEPCKFDYSCMKDIRPNDILNLIKLKYAKSRREKVKILNIIKADIKKSNFSVSFCGHIGSVHFYPLIKQSMDKLFLASEAMKFGWISVLSKNNAKQDFDKILKFIKRYYIIDKVSADSLKSEIIYIKGIFKNGYDIFKDKKNYNEGDLEKFKDVIVSIGFNYEYMRLACSYFLNEIDPTLGQNSIRSGFKDLVLLLDISIKILMQLN